MKENARMETEWQTRTTADLLAELAERETILRVQYDAYDTQLRRNPNSWSLPDRAQQLHELGTAIEALKLFIAERYVEELEADQKFMFNAQLRLEMLTIADIEAHFAQAGEYLRARQFHQAVSVFNLVLRHNPQLAEAFYNRGLAFAQGGKFARAILDFSAALRLKRDFMEAFLHRGMAYNDLQQYAEAILDLTEALDLDPYAAAAYRERGIAKREQKRYAEALLDFDRAVQLLPDDARTIYERGLAHEAAGDAARAIIDYERALANRPGWKLAAQKIAELRQKSAP